MLFSGELKIIKTWSRTSLVLECASVLEVWDCGRCCGL